MLRLLNYPRRRQLLNWLNVIRTWALLTFTNFKLYGLTFIQGSVSTAGLNFGVMDKQVLAAIFGRNESVALVSVKPLNGSFTHIALCKR